jgi:tetratricopeptide (TPR) repeat protein
VNAGRARGAILGTLALGLALWGAGRVLAAEAEPLPGAAAPNVEEQADQELETAPGAGPQGASAPVLPAASPSWHPMPANRLERAWLDPAASLERRVARTRRTALELGAWDFDPAARALLAGAVAGDSLERAKAAVRLAPDLPAARIELARALWLGGESPMTALHALLEALEAVVRHLEASVWFAGSGLYVLAVALLGGGLLTIGIAGIAAGAHAAHDLGHAVSRGTPEFARFALLASLLLVPLLFGEGMLGCALCLLAVAVVYSSRGQRLGLALALAAVWAGAYPVARLAGAALDAFPGDPVARAAYTTAQGLASPVEIARLEGAAQDDPLAARALAMNARRGGNLAAADAIYQRLLQQSPQDLEILNNAANVRLDLGHMESALELYSRASDLGQSPVVLFNLAQAYGRAFQVEDLNRTLALAQSIDGDFVAELTALQGAQTEGFVVDIPLGPEPLWQRALASHRGEPIAAELRAPLAPGRLGHDGHWLAGAGAAALLLGWLVTLRFQPSRWCARCGRRMCPRCDPRTSGGELCESCTRLFFQPEKTDRALRLQRVTALRERERRLNRAAAVASILVPGAAGLLARRPLGSLLGAFFFSLGAAALVWRGGVVPDPLVAGATAPVCFLGLAVLPALAYVAVALTALAARRSR